MPIKSLAANYRKSLPLKVLAITGSNGKTSTKDFAAAVLGRRFRVTKTQGNFNNHVGLPRTMLEATSQDEVAVWEMGMNHPGEVAALAKIAAPDAAIITNIGIAHIEFMGSREAIAAEKGALAEAVGPQGTIILNADDPYSNSIAARTNGKKLFSLERQRHRSRRRRFPKARVDRILPFSRARIAAARNCRCRVCTWCKTRCSRSRRVAPFGLSLEECAAGLASAPLAKARLQIKTIRGVQFIDDSYNANPDSMKAALRTLVELDADGRRIAVLGEMGELGEESERGHREVGECAALLAIDQLITIGEAGRKIARAAQNAGLENTVAVASTSEAAELLAEKAAAGDLVLIKGSRAARTERVLEEFAKRQPTEGVPS